MSAPGSSFWDPFSYFGLKDGWYNEFSPLFNDGHPFETVTVGLLGLSILQPIFITVAGSTFACRRFGLPPETIGVFLGLTYVFQNVMSLLGWVTTTLVTLFFQKNKYWVYIQGTYSMTLCAFISLLNIRLLVVFGTGIGDSRITTYYWTLVTTGFFFGALEGTVKTISPKNITWFGLGISVCGISVNIVHFLVRRLLPKGSEIGYWALYWQILFAIFLSIISGIMWTIVIIFDRIGPPKPVYNSAFQAEPTLDEALPKAVPFFIMLWGGWGAMFFVYPGIAPFSLLRPKDCQGILYTAMYIQAFIGASMFPLKMFGGLDKLWDNDFGGSTLDIPFGALGSIKIPKSKKLYYLFLVLFVPYLMIALSFINAMHYPAGFIGRALYMKKPPVYILTCIYYTSGCLMMNVAWNAVYANMTGDKGHNDDARKLIMTILGVGLLVTLVFSKLVSEGYLRAFRAAKIAVESGLPWPTAKMGPISAFFYWIGRGFSGGFRVFLDMFATDVRKKLLV